MQARDALLDTSTNECVYLSQKPCTLLLAHIMRAHVVGAHAVVLSKGKIQASIGNKRIN
jgi:hypothetical protein